MGGRVTPVLPDEPEVPDPELGPFPLLPERCPLLTEPGPVSWGGWALESAAVGTTSGWFTIDTGVLCSATTNGFCGSGTAVGTSTGATVGCPTATGLVGSVTAGCVAAGTGAVSSARASDAPDAHNSAMARMAHRNFTADGTPDQK